jgi:hypothetical protein
LPFSVGHQIQNCTSLIRWLKSTREHQMSWLDLFADICRMPHFCTVCGQGCQMVSFRTKNPNLGIFWRTLEWKLLIYIYSGRLEYFTTVGYMYFMGILVIL